MGYGASGKRFCKFLLTCLGNIWDQWNNLFHHFGCLIFLMGHFFLFETIMAVIYLALTMYMHLLWTNIPYLQSALFINGECCLLHIHKDNEA